MVEKPPGPWALALGVVTLEAQGIAYRKEIEDQQDFMSSAVASQYLTAVQTSHKSSGEVRPYILSLVEQIESTLISKVDQQVLKGVQAKVLRAESIAHKRGLGCFLGCGLIGLALGFGVLALASNTASREFQSTFVSLGLGFLSLTAGIAAVHQNKATTYDKLIEAILLSGALNFYTGIIHRLLDDSLTELVGLVKKREELSESQQRPRFQRALLHSFAQQPSVSESSLKTKVFDIFNKDIPVFSECERTNRDLHKYIEVFLRGLPAVFREAICSLESEVPKRINEEYNLIFERPRQFPEARVKGDTNECAVTSGASVSGLSYDDVSSSHRERLRALVARPVKRIWPLGASRDIRTVRPQVVPASFCSFRSITAQDLLPKTMDSSHLAAHFLLSTSEHPQYIYRSKDVLEAPILVKNIVFPRKASDELVESAVLDVVQKSTYILGTKNMGHAGIKRLPRLESSQSNFTHKIKFLSSQLSSKRMRVYFEPLGLNQSQQPLVTMVCDYLKPHDRM